MTAWSTFRRTGYPKLFPVVLNNSGGTIDTKIQIRRMNYPGSEYVTNAAEVAKGVTLLGGWIMEAPGCGGMLTRIISRRINNINFK